MRRLLITGHQAFFTREALRAIVETTLANIQQVESEGTCENEVHSRVFTR
jgi:D-lactate dehydrogenase